MFLKKRFSPKKIKDAEKDEIKSAQSFKLTIGHDLDSTLPADNKGSADVFERPSFGKGAEKTANTPRRKKKKAKKSSDPIPVLTTSLAVDAELHNEISSVNCPSSSTPTPLQTTEQLSQASSNAKTEGARKLGISKSQAKALAWRVIKKGPSSDQSLPPPKNENAVDLRDTSSDLASCHNFHSASISQQSVPYSSQPDFNDLAKTHTKATRILVWTKKDNVSQVLVSQEQNKPKESTKEESLTQKAPFELIISAITTNPEVAPNRHINGSEKDKIMCGKLSSNPQAPSLSIFPNTQTSEKEKFQRKIAKTKNSTKTGVWTIKHAPSNATDLGKQTSNPMLQTDTQSKSSVELNQPQSNSFHASQNLNTSTANLTKEPEVKNATEKKKSLSPQNQTAKTNATSQQILLKSKKQKKKSESVALSLVTKSEKKHALDFEPPFESIDDELVFPLEYFCFLSQKTAKNNEATNLQDAKFDENATIRRLSNAQEVKRWVRPNYFLSMRIANERIWALVDEITAHIIVKKPELKQFKVPTKKLHITLLPFYLKSEEEIEAARNALRCTVNDYKSVYKTLEVPQLEFDGIGQFDEQVLFLKPSPNDDFENFKTFSSLVITRFSKEGFCKTQEKESFHPHATVMKISKAKTKAERKSRFKKDLVENVNTEKQFSILESHKFESLDLVKMTGEENGYYPVIEKVVFSELVKI